MALEYSMYPQLLSGMLTDKVQIGSNTDYFDIYTLETVQKLATALGDGFYAENHTLVNDMTIYIYTCA